MPTENRRVATYLPPQIDAALERFKQEKQLKGDSQALILILSEYLGVSSEVVYQSSSQLEQRVSVVENRLNEFVELVTDRLQSLAESMRVIQESEHGEEDRLADGLLSELKSKLLEPLDALTKRVDRLETQPTSELENISQTQETPGQLQLVPGSSELLDEATKELPQPMNGTSLSQRFGLNKAVVANTRGKLTDYPDKFFRWTQEKDPDRIGWEYNPGDKLYHPILVTH